MLIRKNHLFDEEKIKKHQIIPKLQIFKSANETL